MEAKPAVVVLAGPNGAGKSTAAMRLLKGTFGVDDFVNADVIAQGLSPFDPDRVALLASEIMLRRLRQLASRRGRFAFETTLAARSLAPWLSELIAGGFDFNLIYIWLASADMAVARVAERVNMGGHEIPEDTIRRRYSRGLTNLFELYRPLATRWRVYNNTRMRRPQLVALGSASAKQRVLDRATWEMITSYGSAKA